MGPGRKCGCGWVTRVGILGNKYLDTISRYNSFAMQLNEHKKTPPIKVRFWCLVK